MRIFRLLFIVVFVQTMELRIKGLLTALLLANIHVFGNGTDVTFGGCLPGKESCRDCYLTLKKELLSKDDNVYNLSLTFFPPDTNPPEFVNITYFFVDNGVTRETQTWYWIEQSSYFLFPPNSFQFLSLFFGKPEQYYTQDVTVTLNASECSGVAKEHMILLTQRVRCTVH